jgi:hypothetical protein
MREAIDVNSHENVSGSDAARLAALRGRIGWLCHLIRLAATAYAGWVLISLVIYWTDPARVRHHYSQWLKIEIGEVGGWQLAAGFALHFLIWCATAAAAYSVWRLFSGYLAGRIFTPDAATWLSRIATFGLAAQLADIVTRPLISMIVTAHRPPGGRIVSLFANPPDLLIILFLAGFLALAHVFRTAAEIADDHRQIV